jgi:quercetin dioxygenase-like cupin family protein
MQPRHKYLLTVVTSILTLGAFSGGVAQSRAAKPSYVMVSAGAATFVPLDPKKPQGLHQAVLSGDPKVGPVAFLMKFPRGRLPMHYHSSDYYAWIVEGTMKHWLPGHEAEAKENVAGTFWFQPGGADGVHDDECLSDSCTLYVSMNGKFDVIAAPASSPRAK